VRRGVGWNTREGACRGKKHALTGDIPLNTKFVAGRERAQWALIDWSGKKKQEQKC